MRQHNSLACLQCFYTGSAKHSCPSPLSKSMDRVILETQKVCRYQNSRGRQQLWIPTQKEEKERHWLKFEKWDRGFVHFITGRSLDLRKDKHGPTVNSLPPFCRQGRTQPTEPCVTDASDDEAEEPQPKLKRAHMRAHASKHANVAPHHLTMTLPRVTTLSGDILQARPVLMLFEGVGSGTCWMEMTAENIEHLKAGILILASAPKVPAPRQKSLAAKESPRSKEGEKSAESSD